MTDAEKKWRDWDNEFTELDGILPAQCYRHSREAYKESLRSAIEKDMVVSGSHDTPYAEGRTWAFIKVLSLLNSVTPKE